MIVCTVGLSISFLVYIIVFQYLFGYKLGWFPVQGWGKSFWENLLVYAPLPILLGARRRHRAQPAPLPLVLPRRDQPGLRAHGARQGRSPRSGDVDARAAQRVDPDPHQPMAGLPGLLLGSFLIEGFFSIPGIGREVIIAVKRSDFPVIKAVTVYLALRPWHQPAGRPDVQGRRSARPAQMTGASMANGTAPKAPARIVREIPHTVSPGLWALAWRRLQVRQRRHGLARVVARSSC